MKNVSSVKKTQIRIADISFKKEVETRIWLSALTTDETSILSEIIHHSLTIPISQLAEELSFSQLELKPLLEKLQQTALFRIEKEQLIVDKDERKYLESHIEKFEKNFKPDLCFVEKMLNKLPRHLLLQWYAIPRSCNHLFSSIIDLYFASAKIYKEHLKEIELELPPIATLILQELFQAPDFTLSVKELQARFKLSHFEIETLILILEYHFVCFLSYKNQGDGWSEILTLSREWSEVLQSERRSIPRTEIQKMINGESALTPSFLYRATDFLCRSLQTTITAAKEERADEEILKKLIDLQWIQEESAGLLALTNKGKAWKTKTQTEKAYLLLQDLLSSSSCTLSFRALLHTKNIRSIELALRKIPVNQWISLEDFIEGTAPLIENKEPIALKNRGKKWYYARPQYSDQEKALIEHVLFQLLADIGVVETTLWQEKSYFRLTPFGLQFIS